MLVNNLFSKRKACSCLTSLPLSLLNTSIAVDSISDGWFQRGGKDSISSIKRPRPRFRAMLHPGPDHTELNHELWQVCPLEAKRAHMTLGLIKKKKTSGHRRCLGKNSSWECILQIPTKPIRDRVVGDAIVQLFVLFVVLFFFFCILSWLVKRHEVKFLPPRRCCRTGKIADKILQKSKTVRGGEEDKGNV